MVEESCIDLPYTREILARAGHRPVEVVTEENLSSVAGLYQPGGLTEGKRTLVLTRNRGRFLRPCPGTSAYRCCGYHVLNIGMNCPMDCVYCILQAYLNNPYLSFFVNLDDLFAELTQAFRDNPERFWRIGTGEFTDSLVLDRLTALSRTLVPFMGLQTHGVLELKTKTVEIDNLQGLAHGGRTIVSWSLNSPTISTREELHTAPLTERLEAAARCASWGYRLAFHFDPIIFYPGWEDGYAATVSHLFEIVPREAIVWISLGALRFLPSLKGIAGQRFPNSTFFYEEFVEALDGKFRYFRPQRVEMYRLLLDNIRHRVSPATCVYLCMESDEVWQEVFGFVPGDYGGIGAMLDRASQLAIGE